VAALGGRSEPFLSRRLPIEAKAVCTLGQSIFPNDGIGMLGNQDTIFDPSAVRITTTAGKDKKLALALKAVHNLPDVNRQFLPDGLAVHKELWFGDPNLSIDYRQCSEAHVKFAALLMLARCGLIEAISHPEFSSLASLANAAGWQSRRKSPAGEQSPLKSIGYPKL
jgi:hypothetical protein